MYIVCVFNTLGIVSEDEFFFFQAEDGIRDKLVTGVQTCALPIWCARRRREHLLWFILRRYRDRIGSRITAHAAVLPEAHSSHTTVVQTAATDAQRSMAAVGAIVAPALASS